MYLNKKALQLLEEVIQDPRAIFLIGAPNSGKSTFVKNHYPDWETLSRDDILMDYGRAKYNLNTYREIWNKLTQKDQAEINNLLKEKLFNLQKEGKNFLIDMTNMNRKSRSYQYRGIKNPDYNFIMDVFKNPLNVLLERNKQRFKETGKFIPEDVIKNMYNSFEFPKFNEDRRIKQINVIKNGNIVKTINRRED